MHKTHMTKKDFAEWYSRRSNSCSIDNCSAYLASICGILNFHKHHFLSRDNRETFKKIWGKPDTYWKGSEFYFHVWIREFENEKFIVLTAKGKGTCIEICDTSLKKINSKKEIIIRFTEDLYNSVFKSSIQRKGQ